jgi:outer membrane lipoprotein-sorting protein
MILKTSSLFPSPLWGGWRGATGGVGAAAAFGSEFIRRFDTSGDIPPPVAVRHPPHKGEGKTTRALAMLFAALCVVFIQPADAAAPRAVALSAQDSADLHRIETYLESIKTLTADFEQTNQDGSTSEGKLMLSRPGRMRFEYQPPIKMFIVSDGNYVAVDDTELKQVQFYPVDATPVWFLLREGITLSGDVTVTKLEHGPHTIRVTCVQTKDPNNGSITLVFSDQPLTLQQWIVVDQQGRSTAVALINVETGAKLDPALFRLPQATTQDIVPKNEH